MSIINTGSLHKTLDNLNQYFLDGSVFTSAERSQISGWIAGRQGLEGSYANIMFAPTKVDFKGIRLFTGDNLNSKASIAHILGEESLRALYLLNAKNLKTKKTRDSAKKAFSKLLKNVWEKGYYPEGVFCCGKCTAAYWRNVSAQGVKQNKQILDGGIKYLKLHRDGKGKWKRFPFFYTLLALIDIDLPSATDELKYASEVCSKYVDRKSKDDIYGKRKKEIAKRVLSKLNN